MTITGTQPKTPETASVLKKKTDSKLQKDLNQKRISGTSLVVQWLRIQLPMQGTRVRALVQEDLTCHVAAKPVRHNY